MLKKCVVYYNVISGELDIDRVEFANLSMDIQSLDELMTMLAFPQRIDTPLVTKVVVDFLQDALIIENSEQKFIDDFRNCVYSPEWLFSDELTINKLRRHPMILRSI